MLVVEDEALIAFDLADMLGDLGYEDVSIARSFEVAERMLEERRFDVAFFDLNLNGRLSIPLIERAKAAGLFIVVTSGYEAKTIPLTEASDVPRLIKPYSGNMIERSLRARR